MGILHRLLGLQRKQSPGDNTRTPINEIRVPYETVETGITTLPGFYWSVVKAFSKEYSTQDRISLVNRNLNVSCPKCGTDFNQNGFEIG